MKTRFNSIKFDLIKIWLSSNVKQNERIEDWPTTIKYDFPPPLAYSACCCCCWLLTNTQNKWISNEWILNLAQQPNQNQNQNQTKQNGKKNSNSNFFLSFFLSKPNVYYLSQITTNNVIIFPSSSQNNVTSYSVCVYIKKNIISRYKFPMAILLCVVLPHTHNISNIFLKFLFCHLSDESQRKLFLQKEKLYGFFSILFLLFVWQKKILFFCWLEQLSIGYRMNRIDVWDPSIKSLLLIWSYWQNVLDDDDDDKPTDDWMR